MRNFNLFNHSSGQGESKLSPSCLLLNPYFTLTRLLPDSVSILSRQSLLPILLLCLTLFIGVGNAWGAKITDYTKIVSGGTYYIGATLSNNTDYYFKASAGTSVMTTADYGTSASSTAQATPVIITISGTTGTIQFENGNYLHLDASNGKYLVSSSSQSWTFSNQSSKIRLTNNSRAFQRNNNAETDRFGSYASSQTDVWLEAATPAVTYTLNYHDGDGAGTRTSVAEGSNLITALGTPSNSCDATSTTFVGWSTTEITTKTNTKPTFVAANAVVNSTTAAATYYAVYAKCVYTKISDYTDLASGDKIVIRDNKNSNIVNNDFTATTDKTSTTTISPLAKQIWTITGDNTNGWTITSGTVTLGFTTAPTSSNKTQSVSNTTSNSTAWKFANLTGDYAGCISIKKSTAVLEYSSGWKVYYNAGNQYAAMQIFQAIYSEYITTCCEKLGTIKGPVSLSQLATPDPTKLKATWTMNATTGIASYTLEIYDGSTKVKTIENYTSGAEITGLTPCTAYTAKLYAVSQGGDYCEGGLISTSSTCTTNSYSVNYDGCSGVTHSGATTVCANSDFSVTFNTASAAYVLPDAISVTIGGNTATAGTDYTWTKATGVLTIAAAKQTGNIVIDVDGVLVGCTNDPTVTNEGLGLKQNGTFSLSQVDVTTSGWSTGSNTCEWSDYGFVWGTSENPTVGGEGCEKEQVGNSGSATSWNGSLIGDFSTGVTYHYRAYAKNSKTGAEYVYSTTEGTFKPYTVSYNQNDENATGEVATVVVNAGGSVTLPNASAFTLNCNDLTKWALNSASGTQYDPEDTYSSINANAEFFAIWNTRTYTVQYAAGTTPANGGAITGSHANDTKTCGKDLTLPGVTFYSTGYTQIGWAKSDGGSHSNNLSGKYTSDKEQTFYPEWQINTYEVLKGSKTGCSDNDFTVVSSVDHYGSVSVTASPDASHKGSPIVTIFPEGNGSISGTTISNIIGNITVSVSFAAKEAATVKLSIAGSESVVVSDGLEGDSYTLPSEAAECPDLGLYGWYKGEYTHATTAPSGDNYKTKGQTVTLTAGENKFYAVYATIGDPANTYTKITSTGALETGEYLMAGQISNYYGMKNSFYTTNSKMNDAQLSVSDNVASNPDATQIWRITKSTNTITIQSTDDNKYFGFTSNHVALLDDAQDLTYELSEGKWAIYSGSDYLKYESYFQRGTEKVYQAHLFKRDQTITGPYTTDPNCTTHELSYEDPGDEGSIVLSKSVLGEGKTTTATATPSAHYTFSHWTISGTGAGLNNANANPVTVTMGTADAVLTAHFTEKPKCTVEFYNNGGSALSSTTYWLGENPSAPTLKDGTTGDGNACDATSDTHYGWTQTAWQQTITKDDVDAKTAADVKVYAKAAALPAIAAEDDGKTIKYHAVWAQETDNSVSKNYTLSISASDCPNAYASHLPDATANEVGGTGTETVSFGGSGVMNSNGSIQFRKESNGGAGYIYNTNDLGSITSISTGHSDILYHIGTSENPSSGISGGYFKIYNSVDNTNKPSGITVNFTKTVGGTTYSAFLTNCCNQLDQIDGAVTIDGINEGAATAHWVLEDHTGISKYTLNVYKADNSFVKSVDVTNPTLRRADIGGLETCTEYYVTITTVAADGYCAGSEQGKSDNFTTNGWAVHYTSENDETALLSNVTKLSGEDYMCLGEDNYVATFQASVGYKLPSTITVWYTGDVMDEGYTWNSATGTLTIPTAGVSEEFDVRIIGECITPNITADPADAVYALNESATPLSATVEGAGTWCGYQWQSKVGEGDWTNIPSATNSSYTPSTASAGSTTLYRVIVSNIASGCSVSSTSEAATISVSALPVCAQPTFSPAAGTKLGAQSVTLGCETANATIYYTTNGDDPQEIAADLYDGSAIAISQTTTIKAIAAKSGMTTSGVASATYTIKCKAPTFSVPASTYNVAQSVELASDYGTVYYTVDGSDPATDGVEYSEAISVTASTTIRAVAKMANCENSDEASAEYVLKCATPSFSVAEGVQIGAQNVTLSSTIGASIYYTTNNATPTTSSTLYESAIPVSSAMTIKAIAVKDGWSNSDIATAAYTIKYTLTFQNNGVTLAEGGTKNLAPGEAYGTLPTLTSGACDGTSTTFMGWSTAVLSEKQPAAPAYASATDVMGTSNVILNAVWAKASGSAEDDQEHTWTCSTWSSDHAYTAAPITPNVDGENWEIAGYGGNTKSYLQMNTGSGKLSYIYLPEYNENFIVKSLAFSLENSPTVKAYFTTTKPTTSAMTPDACTEATFDGTKSFTMNVDECELTNGYLYVGGSVQVKSVTATYTKVVTYEDYITTCCDEWTATAKYGSNNIINVNDVVAVTVKGDTYGTATYESNKTDVLTVAANGAVTGKKAGSATVTISWPGNAGHCAYATSVDVTVNGPISVTYNANDGSLAPATKTHSGTISSNSAFTLDANSFNRTGYTFQGWATTPSGAKAYDNSQANVSFAEDVTLYAVWSINSHAVTLTQPTGNTITANSSTTPGNVTYGTSVTLSATENETTTDGYIFTSWSVTGITLADATANPAQFTMPDNAVSVTATYSTYTWNFVNYTVAPTPGTVYTDADQFDKSAYTVTANYKRSDTEEPKAVDLAANAWTVKLNGTAIADDYEFAAGDDGKELAFYVEETKVWYSNITVTEVDKDRFIDNLWGNATIVKKEANYTVPTLTQTPGNAGSCNDHNVFIGWVLADDADNPTDDNKVVGGTTGQTPTNKTYYAIWAEHYSGNKDFDASKTSFVESEKNGASLNGDISYTTTQNGGTQGPAVVSGGILRLYRKNSGDYVGGYITISAVSGATISEVEFEVSSTNAVKYKAGAYSAGNMSDVAITDGKVTISELSATKFTLANADKDHQLDISSITVAYSKHVEEDRDYITDCDPRYDVEFNVGTSVTGSYDKVTKKAGVEITLPDGSALSKEHHTFKGWTEDAEGEGYLYTTTYTVPSENKTLYAQWDEDHHAFVHFMNGENEVAGSPIKVYDGGTFDLLGAQTAGGKAFIGWMWNGNKYKEGQTSQQIGNPAEDRTYTATWMPIIDVATANTADLSDGKWILVQNKSQLKAGDFIVIAAAGYDVAISNYQKTSNRDEAAVTKNNDTLSYTSNVAPLFLQYDPENDYYAFYDRAYSTTSGGATNNSGYLYSDNNLKTQASVNGFQGVWSINITDKKASIVAQGNNQERIMRYNAASNAKLFSVYENVTQQDLAIYKWHRVLESGETNLSDIELTDAVIVKNGATLTVDAASSLVDLTVEAGGKVETSNELTVINNLTINSEAGKSGQIINAGNVHANNVYMDVTFYKTAPELDATSANQWYMISAPFDVNLADGFTLTDGTPMRFAQSGDAGSYIFDLFEYDGAKRASTGNTGWKRVQGHMPAGKACLIGFVSGQPTTIRLKAANATLAEKASIALNEYSGDAQNRNWNGVANPNLHYININKDVQIYNNEEGENGRKYLPYTASSYSFVVGTAFFVQETGSISLSAATNGLLRAPKRESERYEACVRIVRDGAETFADQMFVRASEEASNEYEQGHDMITWNGTTAKTALIWSNNYGKRLAIEEAPMVDDQASYALSLYAPADGTYRIETPTESEDATLYLTKDGRVMWNLSMSACEVELTKGTTENYGLLLVRKAPGVATGMENVQSDNVQCTKVIIDNQVFILRGGQMYDLTGKKIEK